MKRLALFMLAAMLTFGTMPAGVSAEEHEVAPGTLVKGSGTAVYYIDEDLTRHVFPNGRIFASWYANFDGVVEVSDAELAEYPLAGNVPYKPGKRLVKIQSDPKTYAVDAGGVLRWVRSEAAARALYGPQWNRLVHDLSDAFFADYLLGDDIDSDEDFDETLDERVESLIDTLRAKRLKRLAKRGLAGDALENRGFGRNKVAVCHNFGARGEHTIFIARPALSAHLGHGDTEGRCAGDDDGEEENDEDESDTVAPTLLSSSVGSITETTARVLFTADEDVTAVVYSSTSTPVDTGTAAHVDVTTSASSHDVALSGLVAETEYHVVIVMTDDAGNETTSAGLTFTTLAETDTTAPGFLTSSVDSATATAATVSITTDEEVTAVVYYGDASPVDILTANSVASATLSSSHDVEITGLAAETAYFFTVVIEDEAGNETTSSELTVTTLAEL